jgi:hypothetical protein
MFLDHYSYFKEVFEAEEARVQAAPDEYRRPACSCQRCGNDLKADFPIDTDHRGNVLRPAFAGIQQQFALWEFMHNVSRLCSWCKHMSEKDD